MDLVDHVSGKVTPKFSVIMPVYNTERYVEAAVQSILNQSEDSLELLIIDDGSDDNSLAVCQKLAQGDPRVRITSQSNAGQGAARNLGLDNASGQFIVFVDSDDTIEPDTLEATLSLIGDADLLSFAFDFVDEYGNTRRPVPPFSTSVLSGPAIFHAALMDIDIFTVPWNKVYRRDVIARHGVRFPPLKTWEDTFFSREMARVSRKAVFDQTVRYHALMRRGSTSRSISPQKFDDAIMLFALEDRAFASELTDPDVRRRFEAHKIKFMMQLLVLAALRTTSDDEYNRCYVTAAEHGFTSGRKSPETLSLLSPKVRVVAQLARHPQLLRVAVRLAAALGLRPY